MANIYIEEFDEYAEIDVTDFLNSCLEYELEDIVEYVKTEYPELLNGCDIVKTDKMGMFELEYHSKFNQLVEHVYKFTEEEEKLLRTMFRKYL
jgi:hypothetical protein